MAQAQAAIHPPAELLLDRIEEIPTLPVVAMRVNDLLKDPNVASHTIAEALKQDQPLTLRVLRLVNSGYYGIPGGVSDVKKAVNYLGFHTLAQLTLGVSVLSLFEAQSEEFSMKQFWLHSLGVAVGSEQICKRLGLGDPAEAFTCGLLHDVGKLVAHELDRNLFIKTFEVASRQKTSFESAEKQTLVAPHPVLGASVARRWGLPEILSTTIEQHHDEDPQHPMAKVVRLADALCLQNKSGVSGNFEDKPLRGSMLSQLDLDLGSVGELTKDLQEGLDKAGALLGALNG